MTTTAEGPRLAVLLCFDLYAASRALTAVYRPLLTDLGLTYPQYLVLIVLWQERSRTVKQLGGALHLDYGTLTPLLRRMETNGLLTRQRRTDDERSVTVELTPVGAAMESHAAHIQQAIQVAVGLNTQEAANLQTTLRSVTLAAHAVMADGATIFAS